MSDDELERAYKTLVASLRDGTTHDAAEIMQRMAARCWIIMATKGYPAGIDTADAFIDALSLDIRDAAKEDGRKILGDTL